MAVKLSANYSKKLGLPAFSSHSFSASVEIELTDVSQVQHECQKLYELLQQSVDQEIQQVGFVPDSSYGGGNHSGKGSPRQNQNYSSNGSTRGEPRSDSWNCTDGQKGFILRIVNENQMDKTHIENLAQQLYQTSVKHLNKMQASQLIEELLDKTGKTGGRNRWQKPQRNAA